MTKINLLYVIEDLHIGGQSNYVLERCERLSKDEFDCFLAYGTDGPWRRRAEAICVKVFRYSKSPKLKDPKNWINHFTGLWRLVRTIRNSNIDIVITSNMSSYFIGSTAANITGIPSVNMVGFSWRTDTWYMRLRRLLPFESYTSKFIVGSNVFAKDFMDIGIEPSKIKIINHGVDLQVFHPNNSGKKIREEFSLGNNVPVVGQVGRLVRDKGFDILLKSAVKVTKEVPSVMFMIVGDGPLRADLELLAQQLGIQQNVIFTGFREDIPDIVAALDIAAFPYRGVNPNIPEHGNIGTFTLEAIASGKPMIFTDTGTECEAVEHGTSGFLVPREDVDALSQAIIFLAKEPRKAREMGLQGRRIAEARFDLSKDIRDLEKLYTELAHLERRPHRVRCI